MKKTTYHVSNAFCPQCLYLYGTYREDGKANYGLFTWATYCADKGFRFVACIGEDKLTRDRIRATGVFSASSVGEKFLPKADFCGNNSGYNIDKSAFVESIRGSVLNVPIPVECPWSYELEVDKTLHLDDEGNSEIYICVIKNILVDEVLADAARSFEERVGLAAPVISIGHKYFPVGRTAFGVWGSWKDLSLKD